MKILNKKSRKRRTELIYNKGNIRKKNTHSKLNKRNDDIKQEMNIINIRNNNLNDNTLLYRGTNPRQQTNRN